LIDFFERHRILLLIIFPIMFFSGMAVGPAAMVVVAIGIGYLFYIDHHHSIVLLLLICIILGDSRADFIQFVKPLRGEIVLIMFLISLYELRNNFYKANALMLYFLPFLWVALLALIFSPNVNTAVSKTISFAILYFMAFNYLHHKFERYGMQLMQDCLYVCLIILVIGFSLLPIIPIYVSYGGIRYNGVLGNPNGMGMFVTLLTPIAYYLFKRDHRKYSKRFKVIAWTLIMASLIMCSSRNAIFSVALFFLLIYGLAGSTFRRAIFLFIFLPAVGIIVYNIDLEQLVYTLGLERYFRIKEFGSGSGRIFAWQHAVDLISRSPLIGCGFACEEYNFMEKTTYQLWHSGHQGGVHNSFLAFAINTGIVGLLCFLGFLANAARKVRNSRFVIPFMLSAMFSAVFESWLFSSLSAFQIMFLYLLVFLIVDTNREELLVSSVAGDFSKLAAEGLIR
jgi:O-antigen ligase